MMTETKSRKIASPGCSSSSSATDTGAIDNCTIVVASHPSGCGGIECMMTSKVLLLLLGVAAATPPLFVSSREKESGRWLLWPRGVWSSRNRQSEEDRLRNGDCREYKCSGTTARRSRNVW